eukprot:CAMPEP_0202688524 /NCGR_PEP_ID=MMETSP1385-20130828/4025_1 /ASSEMBLY_ACC=CAM_ASM_000861 /TAXON_ID=933848 /ORGANISM="Elphidium margaritaceum" /LENGTH=683 /DNA_ID=CAMNT_0049343517 /DNA_START=32 /DNA_END=2083 /DNA_ORIENTATION=+
MVKIHYDFKQIATIPKANDFVDIILSRTNRQTPTVVRARWKISSIRTFYMRKIKFTQQNIANRLSEILTSFPRLDSIHPFYSDLMNVLYDRDHYKIALSQLNIAKQLVNNIGNDYVKLLKYGDSLYRCKQLKRAALGRMVKILKQQSPSLVYLEQVRQHISRLPTIDPYQSTLLLLGFPSTGKSSFMNKMTRAKVEVAEYPFTTKSLYVGHCDYNYLRYQIIDSPGILDRELSQRNTIEMQTITALAHLNCCIVYFIDLSPFSNYSIAQQCKLFQSLQPLFSQKPVIVVCNKCDLRPLAQLSSEERMLLDKLTRMKHVHKVIEASNESLQNVESVKNEACDVLLSHRIDAKQRDKSAGGKDGSNGGGLSQLIQDRLFVAQPVKRDNKVRESVKKPMVVSSSSQSIKELEQQHGGPGVFNFDTRQHWDLKQEEWKYDEIPQFYNGKNIADFYQKNIDKHLSALEDEERHQRQEELLRMMESGQMDDELNADDRLLASYIWRKHVLMRRESAHQRKMRDSRPQIGRTDQKIAMSKMTESLDDLGIDCRKVTRSVQSVDSKQKDAMFHRRGRSRTRAIDGSLANTMKSNANKSGLDFQEIARLQSRSRGPSNVDADRSRSKSRARSRSAAPSKGITSLKASETARKLKIKAISALNRKGKCHESDRRITNPKPTHLFKGKGGPKGR